MKYAHEQDYRMHGYMLRTFGLQHPESAERVLEMGCYHGQFTKRLTELFSNVTVVEADENFIDIAHQAAPKAHFHSSLFEDYTPDDSMHAIFLLHTLEHIKDPGLVLGRIREWLAPKGRLYVAVPNAFAASRQIAVAMGLIPHPWSVTDDEIEMGHNRTYDLTYLRRTITDAGLKIVDSGGIFFKPMSNGQMDKALEAGIINEAYLEGAYQLGKRYPELCSSLYAICTK